MKHNLDLTDYGLIPWIGKFQAHAACRQTGEAWRAVSKTEAAYTEAQWVHLLPGNADVCPAGAFQRQLLK